MHHFGGYAKTPNLHWQSYAVSSFVEQRTKAQRKPVTTYEGAVIVYCRLNELLSEEDWDSMMIRLYRDSDEWRSEIDALFFKATGRTPDRTSARTIKDEGLDLWDRVKLPYTEEQMAKLVEAHATYDHRKNLTWAERKKWYYQAPCFDEEKKATPEAKEEEINPEEVAHADQDAIDQAAASLLEDIDL